MITMTDEMQRSRNAYLAAQNLYKDPALAQRRPHCTIANHLRVAMPYLEAVEAEIGTEAFTENWGTAVELMDLYQRPGAPPAA